MNVNDESDRQLRAAMQRLLDGSPIRSNGSLTVSALAVEAGLSRRTAGRAKGVLRDFQDAIAHRIVLLEPSPVVALPSGGKAGS